ncbi:short-chain dehydrogenase [Trichoderma gamsii]|uniref:Short-chain dehydrogenase n=1 Tax=Trichoderma gamsii TaxID=398673 RepID=A0A2P4ZAQ4_9HYPO|nr:short-chain dehydrogenase [Trichoderma gamsii]PON21384.1 short-chain dehydrogenase [Trichoderma gamsii]
MGAKSHKPSKAQAELVPNQLKDLPIALTAEECRGKTYIVTGANGGLGYEATKHLVRLEAAKVIIGVRNAEAGKAAKSTIEAETNRKDKIEVWDLDLASYGSVKAFAKKVESLERIDALVLNAGALISAWEVKEGNESNITINVMSNFLLAVSVLPHLQAIAKQHEIKPHLVFVGSVGGLFTGEQVKKFSKTDILDDLNDQAKWKRDMPDRYTVSKFLEHIATRELAALVPVSESGVVINVVDPGMCKTNLTRNVSFFDRIKGWLAKAAMGRTAEMGSRTLIHGIAASEESHGKYLTACEIREDHIPEWMTDESGKVLQKQIWTELAERLDKIQPGVVAAIIQN